VSIRIDEKTVGLWYLNTIPGHQDWMAGIREIEPENKYEVTYRFRYYEDGEAFDSKDRKNWYGGTVTGTRAYTIAGIREAGKLLESVSDGKLYELMMNDERDVKKFAEAWQSMPFVFARMESKKVPE
jgi:hypothetical protein